MTETEKVTIGGLIGTLALLVSAFVIHTAPRFPGSLTGSVIGIVAAALFLLLLLYTAVKHQPRLKERLTGRVSLSGLMSFHAYAGSIGAVLGIIHSGHKFESPLGVALVVTMPIVVFTGFIGRYYLSQVGQELRLQQHELKLLRDRFDAFALAAARQPPGLPASGPAGLPLGHLVGAISDLEFAIMARDAIKRTLSRWLVLHIGAAIAMYGLLAMHIWSSVYFGLRWLP